MIPLICQRKDTSTIIPLLILNLHKWPTCSWGPNSYPVLWGDENESPIPRMGLSFSTSEPCLSRDAYYLFQIPLRTTTSSAISLYFWASSLPGHLYRCLCQCLKHQGWKHLVSDKYGTRPHRSFRESATRVSLATEEKMTRSNSLQKETQMHPVFDLGLPLSR